MEKENLKYTYTFFKKLENLTKMWDNSEVRIVSEKYKRKFRKYFYGKYAKTYASLVEVIRK